MEILGMKVIVSDALPQKRILICPKYILDFAWRQIQNGEPVKIDSEMAKNIGVIKISDD